MQFATKEKIGKHHECINVIHKRTLILEDISPAFISKFCPYRDC
jgi:hypothetical protein